MRVNDEDDTNASGRITLSCLGGRRSIWQLPVTSRGSDSTARRRFTIYECKNTPLMTEYVPDTRTGGQKTGNLGSGCIAFDILELKIPHPLDLKFAHQMCEQSN
jgi:hypothetical protein